MEKEDINYDNEITIKNESKDKYKKNTNRVKRINLINNKKSKSLKKPSLILNNENNQKQNNEVNQTSQFNHFLPSKSNNLSYFSQFNGFFNKKFNLTSFKKEKEESRSLSKSPKKLRLPTKIRGNGIPNTIMERLTFLNNFFKDEKFKKIYAKCPQRSESKFDDFCDYVIDYSKNNGTLNAILLSYYFICHEIKYDYEFKDRNENFKKSQQAENVYKSGLALSLGFTNIFETILKKLDIRYMHIEGNCKYLPKDNNNYIRDLNTSKKINTSFTMYNNLNSSRSNNSSKNKYNIFMDNYGLEIENINDNINHCWNSFWYKGEWYLVDTLLGSGSVEIKNNMSNPSQIQSKNAEENFNIFYLLSWPKCLIYSHFPSEDNWQLTDKIWTFKQFLNKYNLDYPNFYKNILQYKVELLTHNDPFIKVNNNDNLKIILKIDNYIIEGNLYNPLNGQKISEVKLTFEQNQKIFTLEPIFPKAGDYILRINLRATDSTDLSYDHLFDYRIKVENNSLFNYFEKYNNNKLNIQKFNKGTLYDNILPKISLSRNHNNYHRIITDYKKIFPSKNDKRICYDNDGFILFEPRSGLIRKGALIKFKVKIKEVLSASLLDGNKFTSLKRTDKDIYEGQKIIETENVSICCLKGKNLFTEVFKFKPRRNRYDLSQYKTINYTQYKKF